MLAPGPRSRLNASELRLRTGFPTADSKKVVTRIAIVRRESCKHEVPNASHATMAAEGLVLVGTRCTLRQFRDSDAESLTKHANNM